MFHVTGMAGEIKIPKFGCSVLEYPVDIFNEFLSKLSTNSVFYSPYIPIKLNTKSFSTTSSKPTIYTLAYITVLSYIETRKSVDYSLYFSGVAKLCKTNPCKICSSEYQSKYLP